MTEEHDAKFMRQAIQEARRSRGEAGRVHPFVGAVVVRDGDVIGSACRGDLDPRHHAEFCVLEEKLTREKLAGCTVYTTLEPCTERNPPKVSCAERLIERRIKRVVIGMLDPDQRITGKGILKLRRAGIAVELFPQEMMAELEDLNREFTRDREQRAADAFVKGVLEGGLSAFYPSRDYYAKFRNGAETIDRYVATATSSVVLVSINLMTGIPFHDLCIALQRKLTAKRSTFTVSISLLDPDHRELMIALAPVLSMSAEELAGSIRRSLANLVQFRNELPARAKERIEIRVHSALPFGSAIMLDHHDEKGRIQIETKPYKAGLQKSLAFEVIRRVPDGLYDVLGASYDALIRDGRRIVGTSDLRG